MRRAERKYDQCHIEPLCLIEDISSRAGPQKEDRAGESMLRYILQPLHDNN